MSLKFLSAEQLRNIRKLPQTFPEYGIPKVNHPTEWQSSNVDNKLVLNRYLDERFSLLSEGKCSRFGQLLRGEYLPEGNVVQLNKITGKGVQHMGYNFTGQSRLLYPEEALYLMDCKRLEVFYKDVALSMQEAYAIFFKHPNAQDKYIVYSHLSALGFTVIRFKCRDFSVKPLPKIQQEVKHEIEVPSEELGEFEGAFARYDKVPASHTPNSLHQTGPCLLLRNPTIVFPNTYSSVSPMLTPSSPHLFPPGVRLPNNVQVDVPPANKRIKLPDDTESDVSSWYSYKNLSVALQPNPLKTPTASSIIQPSNAACAASIFHKLKSVCQSNCQCEKQMLDDQLTVDYDVYLPSALKSGSVRNRPPHHRLIVVNKCDPIPRPAQIMRLAEEFADSIPIHFGVVDNGDVAFYSFNQLTLQPDVLPN